MTDNADNRTYLWGAVLGAVLILPRVARMFYPEAGFYDPIYLDIAASISRGLRPHVDFVHTHFVFPEAFQGLIYLVFWPSHRIAEATTAVVVTVTAILIYRMGSTLQSKRVGVLAALFYATHPAFFLFHIFEKETYQALFACMAAIILWKEAPRSVSRLATAAFICALGFITKIDFLFFTAFICLYLLVVEKRVKDAFVLGGIFAVLILIASGLVGLVYGVDALKQIYLFHFFKGHESPLLHRLAKWAFYSGYLFLMSLAALPFLKKADKNKTRFLFFWLGGVFAFNFGVSATFWKHNAIVFLPPFSLLAAIFADAAIDWFKLLSGKLRGRPATEKISASMPVIMAVLVFLSAFYFQRAVRERFGFGYRSRSEVEIVAKIVRDYSRPSDIIIAPPIIAAESNRTDIVHNREVYPVYVWAMGRIEEVGFWAARREAMDLHFHDLFQKVANEWIKLAWRDIKSRRVAVVVGNKRSLFEQFNPDAENMIANGYRKVHTSKKYVVWVRND